MSIAERFLRYVSPQPSGCWEWTGGLYPSGYGKFKLANGSNGGKAVLAHRVAYQLAFGAIQNVINHKCENKRCVNPAHLEDVTQAQNLAYSRKDVCLRGHDLNGEDIYVDKIGKRHCRACRRIRTARR